MAGLRITVQADVVDIRTDTPLPTDTFLVDINVWYWLTYTRASQADQPPSTYQTTTYPDYVGRARSARATLLYCGTTLAELIHLTEKSEREIYCRVNSLSLKPKEYRHHYPTEQQRSPVSETQIAWQQITLIAASLDFQINEGNSNQVLARYATQPLDGYDLIMLESMVQEGFSQVLTDDSDFASVPGIQLFTANNTVIAAAHTQNKLISR
ncbi:MAG: hypothetical protein HC924_16585 [Synechococcaceae cyanobacterium SM2_3_2]|nr:hypothetical protein [Synechococcaceae cyanobacterium SM2_3_2]